jgi:hypothetical protein
MLTCIGAGSASQGGDPFDYVGAYKQSKLRETVMSKIDEFKAAKSGENKISFLTEYAASSKTQRKVVMERILKIYWRSPS